jgi:DNA-binding response OmpR family regulator
MKTRILLVEDDERLAKLTAEYLRKNDFEVLVEATWQHCRGTHPRRATRIW